MKKKNEQKNADVIYGLYSSKSQEYLRKKRTRRKINRVKKIKKRSTLGPFYMWGLQFWGL